ncbi:MAG: DUF1549 and DUF1553 domain-containing protein [Verrucomicrobiota bacterium]
MNRLRLFAMLVWAPLAVAAEAFWSFRVPEAQAVPSVRRQGWPRVRLDHFVLARLEGEGIDPSPEADPAGLLRRVSYDLTGLPPSPESLRAFLADRRPGAYERAVDGLLASPRFGERWASVWLPLVRYAEDQAHQVGDDTTMAYPNAHRYREWVIDAFNRDLPYDRFLRLQLAADRLGAPAEDLPALGLIGLGPKYYDRARLEVQADEWEDRVDTVTRTVLGLTVACARCHDHKFDPLPMRDYYALAGVFASTRLVNKTASGTVIDGKVKADQMPADALHIVEEAGSQDLPVFLRGDVSRKGPVAERSFPVVLSGPSSVRFTDGSGRRELADRLASRSNPLTARVMVNRLWAACFGKPLVPTPSDFGHSGMPPTDGPLLDDLAVRFMDDGWSVKALVREFVLSSTYRQASMRRDGPAQVDPSNRRLWRMERRRLTVEQWRDSVLQLSGELSWDRGRSVEPGDPANRRRTIHSRISRLKMDDLLQQFDYPDANVHAERRAVTTTATQKLYLLNHPFVLRQAEVFARRLRAAEPRSEPARVRLAHLAATGREPEPDELAWALEFLGRPAASAAGRWEQFAQVLLVSNGLMYVD